MQNDIKKKKKKVTTFKLAIKIQKQKNWSSRKTKKKTHVTLFYLVDGDAEKVLKQSLVYAGTELKLRPK